jgi:hypothetical protein
MSEYTDHKMMKDLEEELKDQKLTHLLKVVKALIFENIKLEDAEREKKKEEHGIDALFKEEKKEEAAPAAGEVGTVKILYQKYEFEIQGKVVDFGMGATLEAVAGQTAKPIADPNEDPNDPTSMGTMMHNNGQPLIIQAGAKFVQMPPDYVWTLISNSGRESSQSARSLEEKLELMRSINVELVELIKSKLL